MKRLLVVLASLMLGCCAGTQRPSSPVVYPAVVLVSGHDFNCVGLQNLDHIEACLDFMTTTIKDPGGPTSGTAFWISHHYVVSAAHVALYAAADPEARLTTSINGKRHKKMEVEGWTFAAAGVDVAIGYVKDPPPHKVLLLCSDVFDGEDVTTHGYPVDAGYETATGRVAGTMDREKAVLLVTAIRGGYSGGPVVSDDRQCVIGVAVQSSMRSKPPLGIAVSVDYLKKFISQIAESFDLADL